MPAGDQIRVLQQTDYPWKGDIQIKLVECSSEPPSLKLRIPGWAKSATLKVDGTRADIDLVPGTYAAIKPTWQGMTVDLSLDMPAQLIESHPLVEATANQIAVKRGPVVYCLESTDLPSDVSLSSVRIPTDVEWRPRFDEDLLEGISVLEGKLLVKPAGDWHGKLYREFNRSEAMPIAAKLIPYYAWSNRGPSEMTVWLPID